MKAVEGCGAGGHSHGTVDGELSPETLAEIIKASRESQTYTIDLTQDSDDEGLSIVGRDIGNIRGRTAGNERAKRPIEVDGSSEESSDDEIQILSSPAKGTRSTSSAKASTSKFKPNVATSKTPSTRPKQLLRPAQTSTPANYTSSDTSSTRKGGNPPSEWPCPECTFVNPAPFALQCQVCLHERSTDFPRELYPQRPIPKPLQVEGWTCQLCQIVMEDKFWMCRSCQRIKTG